MNTNNVTEYTERAKRLVVLLSALQAGETLETLVCPGGWVPLKNPSLDALTAGVLTGQQYRIHPKPEPRLPDGVFWVRYTSYDEGSPCHRLITAVSDTHVRAARAASYHQQEGVYPIPLKNLFAKYHWSRDRKTWYTFDNHETPVAE